MNEEREEPEKFSLVFYKEERLVVQISPPRTIPVRWFYGLGEIELEDVFPLRERIGRWCGVEEPRRIHVSVHSIGEEGEERFVIGVQLGGRMWLGLRTIFPEPKIFKEEEGVRGERRERGGVSCADEVEHLRWSLDTLDSPRVVGPR